MCGEPYDDEERQVLRDGKLLTDLHPGDTIGYCNELEVAGHANYRCSSKITSINNRKIELYNYYPLERNQMVYKEGKLGRKLSRIRLWSGDAATDVDVVLVDITGDVTVYDVSNDGDDSTISIADEDADEYMERVAAVCFGAEDNRDKEGDISNFLERNAIGLGAEKAEMDKYAENLVKIEGCHSVEFIKMHCEDQDVDRWDWMKPMHRKAFKKWLHYKM